MSQPDEDGFNEAPDPEPDVPTLLPVSREMLRRAGLFPCATPAARPAKTAGGSANVETPGPAPDLFGRLAR